jgi:hypothetical protein
MIQNSGKEAIIDLLDGRMEVAEAQLANRISSVTSTATAPATRVRTSMAWRHCGT